MQDKIEKKVDEGWKKKAEEEKLLDEEKLKKEIEDKIPTRIDFSIFVSGLATEAIIHLGIVENPFTKKIEKNINQARYIIDVLQMLEEKTKGNLTPQESDYFRNTLQELRLRFVQVSSECNGEMGKMDTKNSTAKS